MATNRRPKPRAIEYNQPFDRYGYLNVRFVENPELGLRRVGFADEILGLRHTGWHTDDDGCWGTYRGIVYQLPSHKGAARFVYGYRSSEEDYGDVLVFDLCDTKEEAARYADNFAETCAEHERDYQRASQAGSRYVQLGDDVKADRTEALELCREIRTLRGKVGGEAPVACRTLADAVKAAYRRIQKARKERAELIDNYGREEGFKGAIG